MTTKRTSRRGWAVTAIFLLVASGCTLRSGTDYNLVSECCFRDVLILSVDISHGIRNLEPAVGEAKTAKIVGDEIAKQPVVDYWFCPSASVCQTTSEYVRANGGDLHGAVLAAERDNNCADLELSPQYNWSNRSANCPR